MQHPTEKPVKLLQYLITKSTAEGETVLDLFMGSGSTCLAAKQTKRKYIGIEINKTWFDVARARLA
jgi:site-specific DNA-methyltransferase (adenine-specific)